MVYKILQLILITQIVESNAIQFQQVMGRLSLKLADTTHNIVSKTIPQKTFIPKI